MICEICAVAVWIDFGLSTSALPILKPLLNIPLKSIKQQFVIGVYGL